MICHGGWIASKERTLEQRHPWVLKVRSLFDRGDPCHNLDQSVRRLNIKDSANNMILGNRIPNKPARIIRSLGKRSGMDIQEHPSLLHPPIQDLVTGKAGPHMREHGVLCTSGDLTTRLEDPVLKLENGAHPMNS